MRQLKTKTLLLLGGIFGTLVSVVFYGLHCHHTNLSMVFHERNQDNGFMEKTAYKRCLDCGMRRAYDLDRMRFVGRWQSDKAVKCWKYLEAS